MSHLSPVKQQTNAAARATSSLSHHSSSLSGVTSPVPSFENYRSRDGDSYTSHQSGAPSSGLGATPNTLKKQKARNENARSVLQGMSWRFLTESVLDDREYAPPPVLTKEGLEYAQRIERERAASRASTVDSTARDAEQITAATPAPSQAPLVSLFTDLVPASHSAYYTPPLAPPNVREKLGLFADSPSNRRTGEAIALHRQRTQQGATGSLGSQRGTPSRSGMRSPSPSNASSGKQFYADTPLKRMQREAKLNARADLMKQFHPIDPNLVHINSRKALPPLADPLRIEDLNISNEIQSRQEGLMEATRDEDNKLDDGVVSLEQEIINMTKQSIIDSQKQALPAPHPILGRMKKSSSTPKIAPRTPSSQLSPTLRSLSRPQSILRPSTSGSGGGGSRPGTRDSNRRPESRSGLHVVIESQPNSARVQIMTEEKEDGVLMDGQAGPLESPDEDGEIEYESNSGSDDADADDDAARKLNRVQRAREYHAAMLANLSDPFADEKRIRRDLGVAPKFDRDGKDTDDDGKLPSSAQIIVWRESGRLREAEDVPSSVAEMLLNEPTTEDRMRFLQRLNRAQEEEAKFAAERAAAHGEEPDDDEFEPLPGPADVADALRFAINGAGFGGNSHSHSVLDEDLDAHTNPFMLSAAEERHHDLDDSVEHAMEMRKRAEEQRMKEEEKLRNVTMSPKLSNVTIAPNTPQIKPYRPLYSPLDGISPSAYEDPKERFKEQHKPIDEAVENILKKEVNFEYESTASQKKAAERAAEAARVAGEQAEAILSGDPLQRRKHKTANLTAMQVSAASIPEFKFSTPLANHSATDVLDFAQRSRELSAQQAETAKKRAEAAARRAALSPSSSNPLPPFRGTNANPLGYSSASNSSFTPSPQPKRVKKQVGAWYIPQKDWKVEPVAANNEEAQEREEALEAAARIKEGGVDALPKELQEKAHLLDECIPTLFIASVYKGHLEKIAKTQKVAREREEREAAAAALASGNFSHVKSRLGLSRGSRSSPPGSANAKGGLTFSVTSPQGATSSSSHSNSTTNFYAPPPDPLAKVPVRLPSYLENLIPLDPSNPETVIVDFPPGTNKVLIPRKDKDGRKGASSPDRGASRRGMHDETTRAVSPWSGGARGVNSSPDNDGFSSRSPMSPQNPNVAAHRQAVLAKELASTAMNSSLSPNKNQIAAILLSTPGGKSSVAVRRKGLSPQPQASVHGVSDMIIAHQSASIAALVQPSAEEALETSLLGHPLRSRRGSIENNKSPTAAAAANAALVGSSPLARSRRGSIDGVGGLSAADASKAAVTASSKYAANSLSPAAAGAAGGRAPRSSFIAQPHIRHAQVISDKPRAVKGANNARVNDKSSKEVIPGLTTHHHAHTFLPNISPIAASFSNKERAAASVQMRTHLALVELSEAQAMARATNFLNASRAVAPGNPASPAILANPASSEIDTREYEPDEPEYAHPLEIGMKREPAVVIRQSSSTNRRSSARSSMTPGEEIIMRRLPEGDEDDENAEGAAAESGDGSGEVAEAVDGPLGEIVGGLELDDRPAVELNRQSSLIVNVASEDFEIGPVSNAAAIASSPGLVQRELIRDLDMDPDDY